MLDELLAKGGPVDAEGLRGSHLVSARLPEHRAQQRLLDEADHQVQRLGPDAALAESGREIYPKA